MGWAASMVMGAGFTRIILTSVGKSFSTIARMIMQNLLRLLNFCPAYSGTDHAEGRAAPGKPEG